MCTYKVKQYTQRYIIGKSLKYIYNLWKITKYASVSLVLNQIDDNNFPMHRSIYKVLSFLLCFYTPVNNKHLELFSLSFIKTDC